MVKNTTLRLSSFFGGEEGVAIFVNTGPIVGDAFPAQNLFR